MRAVFISKQRAASGFLDQRRSRSGKKPGGRRKEETVVVDKRCLPRILGPVPISLLSLAEKYDGRKRMDDAAEESEKRFEIITTFPTNKKRNGDTSVR